MKILAVAGARPNFAKIAPIVRAVQRARGRGADVECRLTDTGQHYHDALSAWFFRDLQIPPPERTLQVGSGSHAIQTAEIMRRFEPVLIDESPDILLVVGDVNSTLACALVAAKLGVRVAHVEAGLRSFDRSMPEEINRVLTDALSDFLFTTEESANRNLRSEGIAAEKIFFVGNVMVDSLRWCEPLVARSSIIQRLGLFCDAGRGYALATLHRPANVDHRESLRSVLDALARIACELPVILPAHPRTRARIEEFGFRDRVALRSRSGTDASRAMGRPILLDPLSYPDCIRLMSAARLVLTDSGGIQEETTALGVPCITLRDNTERPVTLDLGTNTLAGTEPDRIVGTALDALAGHRKEHRIPPLWDGNAAERIVEVLVEHA
jgi:UDP-N-acetylglucosamine 2-epimerase (non-hydrolysing)